MPWKIVKGENDQACVVKDDENESVVHCYSGPGAEAKAKRLMAALYANVEDAQAGKSLAVKAIAEDEAGCTVGGYLALWGGPGQRDLQGDYFTSETQLWLDHYKTAPLLFHHGLDTDVGLSVIGKRVGAATDEIGIFVKDWIDKSNKYWTMVEPLLQAGRLYYSPGSAPHLVKRADDGRLLSFPVVEDTLTPMPAQYRLRPIEQIKAAYKSASIDMPETTDAASAGALDVDVLRARIDVENLLSKLAEG